MKIAIAVIIAIIITWILIMIGVFTANGQTVVVNSSPHNMEICGGVSGHWLTIFRADTKAVDQRGFDPSFTALICDFKPIVHKLPNGQWEVTFVSELAEKDNGIP